MKRWKRGAYREEVSRQGAGKNTRRSTDPLLKTIPQINNTNNRETHFRFGVCVCNLVIIYVIHKCIAVQQVSSSNSTRQQRRRNREDHTVSPTQTKLLLHILYKISQGKHSLPSMCVYLLHVCSVLWRSSSELMFLGSKFTEHL